MRAGGIEVLSGESPEQPLETTEIHDVLRNDQRRHVLERLQETDGPIALSDLAEHVAAVKTGKTPAPQNVRQSVYVSLHQTYLPKLDELGVVSYESTGKEVHLAEHAPEVTVYLEVVPKYGLSWGEYYLGLGVLGLLVQVAGVAGVPLVHDVGAATFAWSSPSSSSSLRGTTLPPRRRRFSVGSTDSPSDPRRPVGTSMMVVPWC